VELQGRLAELQRKGLGLAAISYDAPDILARFSRERGITFPLLSDAGSATIKRYGILNTLAEEGLGPNASDPVLAADVKKYVSAVGVFPRMVGMAYPGTFILDRNGRVRSRFFEQAYNERNTFSNIMMRLGDNGSAVAGTAVSTDHLEVRTYPSEASIAVGNRFSIFLEVTPGPRIHVYAPGSSSYQVIGVRVAPQPFVRALPIAYPPSQTYTFKPLNERVQVYGKPFTLVQEIVLEGSPEATRTLRGRESLTVTGSLDYQACDDKVCFNPASVPLSWTVPLRALVPGGRLQ
jgi:peroxiredoxin